MRLSLPRPTLDSTADQLDAAWRWWLAELRTLVPEWLRHRLLPDPAMLVLAFDGEGVALSRRQRGVETPCGRIPLAACDGAPPPLLATALTGLSPDRVELRLPAAQVLHQRLVLPLAAARRLPTLLRFELDRQTPFTPEQIYWAGRIIDRDPAARRMRVAVALVKRSSADHALGLARRWGLTPQRLGIEGEPDWALDFQPQTPRGLVLRPYRLPAALAACAIGLTIAAFAVHGATQEAEAASLQVELARSRAAADHAASRQKEVDGIEARLAFLAQRKQATSLARLLEELAVRLPNDSWVTEIELNGKVLRLHGLSQAAPALLGKLGESPLLGAVHFTAPAIPAGAGAERFDISAALQEGGK